MPVSQLCPSPPPDQANVGIALLDPPGEGMHYDGEAKAAFKVLLEKGALGAGVLYTPIARLASKLL